jgi:hypothetical protein
MNKSKNDLKCFVEKKLFENAKKENKLIEKYQINLEKELTLIDLKD